MQRLTKIDDYTYEAVTRMGRGTLKLAVWGMTCTCDEYRRNASNGILDCSHKLLFWYHGPSTRHLFEDYVEAYVARHCGHEVPEKATPMRELQAVMELSA